MILQVVAVLLIGNSSVNGSSCGYSFDFCWLLLLLSTKLKIWIVVVKSRLLLLSVHHLLHLNLLYLRLVHIVVVLVTLTNAQVASNTSTCNNCCFKLICTCVHYTSMVMVMVIFSKLTARKLCILHFNLFNFN